MADEAERQNATPNDESGIVRAIVTAQGLGFNAWFCVCCELADRKAHRLGFKNQSDLALQSPGFQSALAKYKESAA
jgi:hypothetical protein